MVFVVNLGRVLFAPLLDPLGRALGADPGALGLLASLVWVGSALPRIPTGYLLTKVSRRAVVFGAGLMLAGATVLASVAPGIYALQAAGLLMGVAGGAYFIAANPLVSELFPERVGLALGVHGVGAQLAAVGAPLVVSAVLAVGTWQTVFQVMAVGVVVGTVAFTLAVRRTDLPEAGSEDGNMLAAVRSQWRIVVAGVVLIGVESTAQQVLSVTFAAGVPAFAISGRLADRLPVVPYILLILGAFAAAVAALTVASGLVAVVAVSLVLGYVIHSLFPAMDTYLLGSLPDRHRASAYAAYSGTMMFVQAGGSWVVGSLRDAGVPFDTVFQTFAAGLGVALVALVAASLLDVLPSGARA
ncbi:MFS transporter [Halobacteriales archaeon SW_7_68_16]|nr:MAG: MFS transporter [Halobacteriales archaeon SW_7_68_16]